MVNLVVNENMKIYRRWRTWIMIGVMVAFIMTGSIMDWYYDDRAASDEAWRVQVTEQLQQQREMLKDPEIHPGWKEEVEKNAALNEYRLEHDVRSPEGTMWDAINGIAGLSIIISLLTIIVAGDSLAGEFQSGTIKMLLIRPVTRTKILVSKYLSVMLFGVLLLVILFILSVLLNGMLYQFNYLDLPHLVMNDNGQVEERNMVVNLWKTYLLNGVTTVMFVTMAFMISAAFRSGTMAIGFSLFALFAGTIAAELVRMYDWGKYLLFSNLDLTQHLINQPYQEGMTLGFSITVLIVYFLIFNLVAWLVFTRRDVAA